MHIYMHGFCLHLRFSIGATTASSIRQHRSVRGIYAFCRLLSIFVFFQFSIYCYLDCFTNESVVYRNCSNISFCFSHFCNSNETKIRWNEINRMLFIIIIIFFSLISFREIEIQQEFRMRMEIEGKINEISKHVSSRVIMYQPTSLVAVGLVSIFLYPQQKLSTEQPKWCGWSFSTSRAIDLIQKIREWEWCL